jgi:outer membrane protein
MRRNRAARQFLVASAAALAAWAQLPPIITLDQAQQIAFRNHPRIASATATAQASHSVVSEVRAAYFPTLSANLTGVGAEHGSAVSAGALTTSSLFSRGSTGFQANQLVTDFGRTSNLAASAKLRSASQDQDITYTRAQVAVEVRDAYFAELAAESVLQVAQATLDLRRLTLRQVSALAQSSLRSTVDVSFAQVNVSQAELDLFRAQSAAKAGHARLSGAMGFQGDETFRIADEPLPAFLNPNVDDLIAQALRERPDLGALRLNEEALNRYAEAEKRLRNPTVSAGVTAGVAPVRDDRLQETYSAAGINVNIPVLNGGLFRARHEEALQHATAASKDLDALSVRIARDVRIAWLAANDAFQRIAVTVRMVAEADESLRLAQARYDNALGSIVELNQAQLNQTAAQITAASAKYEYLSRRAELDYEIGALR